MRPKRDHVFINLAFDRDHEWLYLVLAHRAALTVRVPSTDMPRSTRRRQDVESAAADSER